MDSPPSTLDVYCHYSVHVGYIFRTIALSKFQGTLRKRTWADFIYHRIREVTVRLCFVVMSEATIIKFNKHEQALFLLSHSVSAPSYIQHNTHIHIYVYTHIFQTLNDKIIGLRKFRENICHEPVVLCVLSCYRIEPELMVKRWW